MKLQYGRTALIGLGFLSVCSFWSIYDAIIPLMLKNTFHMSDSVSGFIMALDNILSLFLLPLFGALSDKTRTRFGKRMPYIVGGTALSVVLMLLIPLADHLTSIVLFLVSLGALLVALSLYRSPTVALMPDLTAEPLRSKANAVINLMGAVGSLIALGLVTMLVPKTAKPDYFPLFISVALVMALSVLVLACTVKEKSAPCLCKQALQEEKKADAPSDSAGSGLISSLRSTFSNPKNKNLVFLLLSVLFWYMGYNAVISAFTKYADQVWGMHAADCAPIIMIAQAVAIVSFLPIGWLSTRLGRKRMVCGGVLLLLVSFILAGAARTPGWYITVLFITAAIGWASINVNSYPMVVEMSSESNVGKYTGYYYTFSMAAQIATPILSGFLLQHVGYGSLFPYATICVLISFVTMLYVRRPR